MNNLIVYVLAALATLSFSKEMFAQSGWFLLNSGNNSNIESLSFPNENTGYICADSMKKTTNGGVTWHTFSNLLQDFTDVHFFDESTGVFSEWFGRIYKTTNGGNTVQLLSNSAYGIFSISFPSQDTGYILTKYNGIWKTTNGGISSFRSTNDLFLEGGRVFFVNNQTGFATGAYSPALKTTNGGISWDSLWIGDLHFDYGIYFFDANTGFITGYLDTANHNYSGKIYKTTTGGSIWSFRYLDSCGSKQTHLYFIDQNTGFIFGELYQMMFKTIDGGNNWFKVYDNNFSSIYRMQFVNQFTGYAVSLGGWIIKTTNGGNPIGIQPISTEIPNQFSLSQNYPNPFNPTTKIKFDIPKSSFGKLVVYNALGREMKTIVNEQLNVGTYEISFDASNYSSGLYFYKLTVRQAGSSAGDYTETKKMVLIK